MNESLLEVFFQVFNCILESWHDQLPEHAPRPPVNMTEFQRRQNSDFLGKTTKFNCEI